MGIRKDFSVVADSEMASSPHSSAPSPVPIRRAARTYGRRREAPDTSFAYSEQDSRDSIYKTGPPGMSDEIPPSEPSGLPGSEDEEEDGDGNVLPSSSPRAQTGFGWKRKVQEIDEKEDLSEYLETEVASESVSDKDFPPTTPAVLDVDIDSPPQGSPVQLFKRTLSKDASLISLLSVTSPSQPSTSQARSPRPSSLKSLRSRSSHKSIITSDMHGDDLRDSRLSSPQTSSPHLIATPKSHRTTSPPTSHQDDVSANSAPSSATKGKGKHKAQQLVEPLRLEAHPASRSLENATRPRSGLGQREKKRKVKPPTKKELRETAQERARLAVGQEVSIDKPVANERSLKTFFNFIHGKNEPRHTEEAISRQPSSPIHDFSSSPRKRAEATQPSTTREPFSSTQKSPMLERSNATGNQLIGDDSDSEGLPNVGEVMSSAKSKENMEQEGPRKEQLLQLKLQLLEKRANAAADDSSDDGLEVEPPTKLEQQRKSAEKKKMSHGKRMILSHARVQTKRPVSGSGKASKDGLEAQAAMLKHGTTDPGALTTWLRDKVEKESRMIVKQKEETWVRLGGAVKEQEASGPTDNVTRNQIQKGFEEWSKPDRKIRIEVEEVDEDEEEDPDWMSDASPSMSPKQEEEIDYEKMEMGEMSDDEPKEQDNGANSNPSQSDNARAIKVKSRHRPRTRVVDSDESDSGEYNDDNVAIPNPRDNRYVVSSSDDRTEDENDKENNTRLMFDRSEDKENKAVARHEPQSIFDAIDHDRSLSPPFDPTLEPEPEAQSLSQTAANPNDKRKPFGVISDASPLSLQRQPSTLTQAFAAQLKHSSPTRVPIEDAEEGDVFGPIPSTPGASLDFAPLFGGGDAGKDKRAAPLGFPQHSQDGLGSSSMGFGAPALLKPGFSDLFESSTQKEDVCVPAKGLQRQDTLALTQDLVLQPAFQVDEKLLRKADAIFEKEQGYVVEAAGNPDAKESEFYVNEVGLLTQTKPSASRLGTRSPSFILSPTQSRTQQTPLGSLVFTQPESRRSSDPTQSQRPPLRTISLSNPSLSSPEASPKRRRLRKRGETPTSPTINGSPVRSPIPSNTFVASPRRRPFDAFERLLQGASKNTLAKKDKHKDGSKGTAHDKKMRQQWLAEEAEESDEDQMAGFGFIKKKDGEGDEEGEGVNGEDLDAPLAELVDDQKMDEEVEAADRVMEKHQELMEKDDEAAFKFHQGVVQGELRKKRKNRFGLDDSDEEDEEDDKGRRIRRKMRDKKERDDIQALAADGKTAAFANVYQAGLVDDEPIEIRPFDFSHDFKTSRELEDEDVVMDDDQDYEQENREDGVDAEDEDEEEELKNRYVTYKDIQAEARKMNEQPEDVDVPDYEDMSWYDKLDADEGDSSVDVRVIEPHSKKPDVPTTSALTNKATVDFGPLMLGGLRRKENSNDIDRLRAWAKAESRNMTGSTGRRVGGIAVTGHGLKTKNGGGSLRSKGSVTSTGSSASSSGLGGKKSLKAEGSVLAGLGKRKFQ